VSLLQVQTAPLLLLGNDQELKAMVKAALKAALKASVILDIEGPWFHAMHEDGPFISSVSIALIN